MQGVAEILFQLGASFGVGFYTAISPCLFPLLPLMLLRTLQSENSRRRSVAITMTLVVGILSSLAVFAIISGLIGIFLLQNHNLLQAGLGALLIFLGFVTMSERLRNTLHLSTLSLTNPPETPTSLLNVYLIGLGYSLLAAPCSGPALLGAFVLFGSSGNVMILILMFLAVSVGVTIPYLVLGLASGEARDKITTSLTHSAHKVEIIVGVLLIIIGIILALPYFGIFLPI
ncbi:MAG: cytochrome c biogenesis CcdA family protein [Candidatus Thorarchaeota archaeon]